MYEKLVDVMKDENGMADCYARMAKLAADALDDRAKAVELWGRVVDIRGEDAIALSGLADLLPKLGAQCFQVGGHGQGVQSIPVFLEGQFLDVELVEDVLLEEPHGLLLRLTARHHDHPRQQRR